MNAAPINLVNEVNHENSFCNKSHDLGSVNLPWMKSFNGCQIVASCEYGLRFSNIENNTLNYNFFQRKNWLGFMAYQPLCVISCKSSLYIYIKYIWFGLDVFYGLSTFVGYLMTNPLYTYISNRYDLVWLYFMAYQPLSVI